MEFVCQSAKSRPVPTILNSPIVSLTKREPLAKKKFYGWYILTGGFLILALDGGVRFSFGILIKPLISDFPGRLDNNLIRFLFL